MEKKASELLGQGVIAGVTLETGPSIRKLIGGGLGLAIAGVESVKAAVPGDHKGLHYVGGGPTKVGFFSLERGLFKPSINELLVERPREDVAAVEIKKGAMRPAHFVFKDGTDYVLLCGRINTKKLKKVKERLTAE